MLFKLASIFMANFFNYFKFTIFTLLSNIINCQEQLKTILQTEKRKKFNSFLAVCIMSLIALCDTISK